jgi:hypothetical protein
MNGRFYKIGSSLAQRRRGNGAIGIYDITNPDHRRALTRHVFSLGRRSDRRPTRNRSS